MYMISMNDFLCQIEDRAPEYPTWAKDEEIYNCENYDAAVTKKKFSLVKKIFGGAFTSLI